MDIYPNIKDHDFCMAECFVHIVINECSSIYSKLSFETRVLGFDIEYLLHHTINTPLLYSVPHHE